MNRWKDRAVQRRKCRSHGVYVEEPHLLPETLSASMSESQKFGTLCTHVWLLKNLANGSTSKTENSRLLHIFTGTHSQFDRSKYRTHDRRKLGPKFDEYSPHVPKTSHIEKLPLEYRCNSHPSSHFSPCLHVVFSRTSSENSRTDQLNCARKMLAIQSKARPGIRKSYMDDVLKRGTATRDKHRAATWDSVE